MDNLSQTDVLSKCRFILHLFCHDAWRNLWLSGDTGTLTINKMVLPIEVLAEMVCHIITSVERNTNAIESQSFAAGITAICLSYGRD